jgi:Transposase family tnp2
MLSLDGAQLYEHKASDCWIYIWVIFNHAPDARYKKKHVLPGGFIPGLNKPKNVDSYLFPGLHHLLALQCKGLRVWDASWNIVFVSKLLLGLATADGPGMAYLNGLVGHHGKNGCRLYCSMIG